MKNMTGMKEDIDTINEEYDRNETKYRHDRWRIWQEWHKKLTLWPSTKYPRRSAHLPLMSAGDSLWKYRSKNGIGKTLERRRRCSGKQKERQLLAPGKTRERRGNNRAKSGVQSLSYIWYDMVCKDVFSRIKRYYLHDMLPIDVFSRKRRDYSLCQWHTILSL